MALLLGMAWSRSAAFLIAPQTSPATDLEMSSCKNLELRTYPFHERMERHEILAANGLGIGRGLLTVVVAQ